MIKGFGKCFGLRKKKDKSGKKTQVSDDCEDKKLVAEENNAKIVVPEQNNAKIVVPEQNNAKKEVVEEEIVKKVVSNEQREEWYKIVKDGKEVNVSKEEFDEFMNSELSSNETKKGVSGRQVSVHNEWYKIIKDGKEITLTKDEFDNYMQNSGLKPFNNRNENHNSHFDESDGFEPILHKDCRNEKPSIEKQDISSAPLSDSEFAADCLKWHNNYRRKHGVPDLVLNTKLSSFANEWANQIAKSGHFTHRSDSSYGENIWYRSFSDPSRTVTGKDPVDDWYNENSRYQFGVESNSLSAGHFTQVVWKSSKELGVGMARNGNKWYVVCNYDPRGNMMGDFVANVPSPIN